MPIGQPASQFPLHLHIVWRHKPHVHTCNAHLFCCFVHFSEAFLQTAHPVKAVISKNHIVTLRGRKCLPLAAPPGHVTDLLLPRCLIDIGEYLRRDVHTGHAAAELRQLHRVISPSRTNLQNRGGPAVCQQLPDRLHHSLSRIITLVTPFSSHKALPELPLRLVVGLASRIGTVRQRDSFLPKPVKISDFHPLLQICHKVCLLSIPSFHL